MPKKNPPRRTVNRSAVTGEFVTEQYAKRHPRTTVAEHLRPPPKGPSGKGKRK